MFSQDALTSRKSVKFSFCKTNFTILFKLGRRKQILLSFTFSMVEGTFNMLEHLGFIIDAPVALE